MANASRLELHEVLCEILGNRNVYYQPPSTVHMKYDAIRYSLGVSHVSHADDKKYLNKKCYEGIMISKMPDPDAIDKIAELPYCSIGKPYAADNLYHYPFTLYY